MPFLMLFKMIFSGIAGAINTIYLIYSVSEYFIGLIT